MATDMWDVPGQQLTIPDGFDLELVRVLYEYDGPRIFTCKDTAGKLLLAYLCSEDRTSQRFLLVPFDSGMEQQLTSGQISLRDALTRPAARIVDVGNDGRPVAIWRVEVEKLPGGVLPQPGVMLWANLQPAVNGTTPTTVSKLASPPA
jgi:hypothetical protein